MRAAIVFAVVGLLVGVFASLAFGVLRDDGDAATAELRIEPSEAGGPRGVGSLRHRDGRLTGWIVVWGLEPGSRHAVHFHGPGASCGAKADPVAVHDDLVADPDGVATFRLDEDAPAAVLDGGVYYNVHAEPSSASENPEIACGDVRPASA
jgi:hypothetical protein